MTCCFEAKVSLEEQTISKIPGVLVFEVLSPVLNA